VGTCEPVGSGFHLYAETPKEASDLGSEIVSGFLRTLANHAYVADNDHSWVEMKIEAQPMSDLEVHYRLTT
jgi:hypothetical protein